MQVHCIFDYRSPHGKVLYDW